MTYVYQSRDKQSIKFTTRVPGNPGSLEENLSITRVVKSQVIWTHYSKLFVGLDWGTA